MLTLVLIVLLVVALCGFVIERTLASVGYQGPISDHFDGTRFYSIGRPRTPLSFEPQKAGDKPRSIWAWLLTRPRNEWRWIENTRYPLPNERVVGSDIVVTFVNHATVLIQTEGLNIITDPVWAKRASPFSFVGPKRYRAPGIALSDLPPIDLVLLSHNHYDHMDIATLREIDRRFHPTLLTGLGNAAYLDRHGVARARDMDWWDREKVGEVTIVATPAQHFSARSIGDRNKTLWCGFVIETVHGAIYFAGDTGYGDFAKEIAKRYSSFRFALLPIGAFKPDWMMKSVHVSPDEAIALHRELSCAISVGIHHSTFKLADDTQMEPIERLRTLLENDPSKPDMRTLDHGESLELS